MATPAFTPPLLLEIQDIISRKEKISFHDYMELALYHPQYGYYAQDKQRVGKQGDFITSVSIGSCFGNLLAQRLIQYWLKQGSPKAFHIVEPGAHDGTLANDILNASKEISPEFYRAVHYHLIEKSAQLKSNQLDKLRLQPQSKFTSHSSLDELQSHHGAIISNELLDAFPIELIRFENNQWQQLFVTVKNGNTTFISSDFENLDLKQFCQSLGNDFPEGYTTEYNPHISLFTENCSRALSSGLFITIDYGYETAELYHPARSTGTLQTYHHHHKAENPLLTPGEIDITSHVDFSRLINAAKTNGFTFKELSRQSSYLTKHAKNWLINLENTPSENTPTLLRQFQTLTHPSMLGTKFMVLEMEKT